MVVAVPARLDLRQGSGLHLDCIQMRRLQLVDILANLFPLNVLKRK